MSQMCQCGLHHWTWPNVPVRGLCRKEACGYGMYVISSWADQSSEECPNGCKDYNIDKRAEWPHLLLCNKLPR